MCVGFRPRKWKSFEKKKFPKSRKILAHAHWRRRGGRARKARTAEDGKVLEKDFFSEKSKNTRACALAAPGGTCAQGADRGRWKSLEKNFFFRKVEKYSRMLTGGAGGTCAQGPVTWALLVHPVLAVLAYFSCGDSAESPRACRVTLSKNVKRPAERQRDRRRPGPLDISQVSRNQRSDRQLPTGQFSPFVGIVRGSTRDREPRRRQSNSGARTRKSRRARVASRNRDHVSASSPRNTYGR